MLKPIEGYEGLYSITPDGRVWTHAKKYGHGNGLRKGKWLKPIFNKKGYCYVNLYKNGKLKHKTIHRLVAQAYIPNHKNKLEINHKNGIKNDNRVENLEHCTKLENIQHAIKNGLFNSKEENNGRSKLTQEQVNEIRNNHISEGIMKTKPWEKNKIHYAQYYKILNNKLWKV